MTIDHANPQNYRTRNGRKVVAIVPLPKNNPSAQLLVITEHWNMCDVHPCYKDGRYSSEGESPHDLIPHDPVLYYANVYKDNFGLISQSFSRTRKKGRGAIARIAVHASGKVRQIPLDANEDPEG